MIAKIPWRQNISTFDAVVTFNAGISGVKKFPAASNARKTKLDSCVAVEPWYVIPVMCSVVEMRGEKAFLE